jgi:hypothetical protein
MAAFAASATSAEDSSSAAFLMEITFQEKHTARILMIDIGALEP